MKILVTVFDIQDYGGIIQHTELLMRGLKELGHEITFRILRCADRPPYCTSQPIAGAAAFRSEASEPDGAVVWASQTYGWRGARVQCYEGNRIHEWRELANAHDLVIHELPVAKADPVGWWRRLYAIKTPQIAIAHDAHFRTLYPHMVQIADKLVGVACTNHAGYRALEWLPVPRAFIASGHVPLDWKRDVPWKKRPKLFICAHIWKRWKHMDAVVRAIPYLPKGVRNLIGGDGIERRYMTSKEKCRAAYMNGKKKIWDEAIIAGMDYRGDMIQGTLLEQYGRSRVMVDMSYSAKFTELGNHFNRSTFDAYNGGAVPLAVTENMREHPSTQRPLFAANGTHLEIGHQASLDPKVLAECIGRAVELSPHEAKRIVDGGRDVLMRFFHYKKAASDYLSLWHGKPAGIYSKLEKGKATPEILAAAKKHISSARADAEEQ